MYKVLIAEDEMLVRLGLVNSVAWEKLDMTVCAQASNGVQALELFQQEHPQIVITDIRMPLMDGMELIQKIRETDSDCRIIIITCVDEFSYAQKAISYQISDYILKLSMNIQEIENILDKIRKSLDKEQARSSSSLPQTASHEQENQELYDCLCGHCSTFSYNSHTAPFFSGNFQVAFIRILRQTKNSDSNPKDRICSDKSLYQLLQQQLTHDGAILVEKGPGEYFLLFQNLEIFSRSFEDTITLVKNYYNSQPVCGISSCVSSPEQTFKAAQQAHHALCGYFFHPQKYIFRADITENNQELKAHTLRRIQEIILSYTNICSHITEIWSTYEPRIRQFLSDIAENSENIRKLFYYLADWFQEDLKLPSSEALHNSIYNYRRYVFETDNIEDIYYIFNRLLNKLLTFYASDSSLSREMTEIIRYIERHYAENLTLDDLSAQVNFSKGYLCNIFRKELNTSFSNYLARVRISHAKKLLTSSFLRLYEIAEQTGFYDYSHFARTFKKVTGFSPQEYQNHQIANEEDANLT